MVTELGFWNTVMGASETSKKSQCAKVTEVTTY
uniref:Uncharacterized protein n=1 Tax=Arundo donax TaxID=35708 RepID=A0A0A9HBU8_ARUDO